MISPEGGEGGQSHRQSGQRGQKKKDKRSSGDVCSGRITRWQKGALSMGDLLQCLRLRCGVSVARRQCLGFCKAVFWVMGAGSKQLGGRDVHSKGCSGKGAGWQGGSESSVQW